MTPSPEFWTLKLTCGALQAPLIEDAFADESVACSTLLAPDPAHVVLEILFQNEPDLAQINARLLILAELSGSKDLPFELIPVGNLDWIKKVAGDFAPLDIGSWTIFGAAFKKAVKEKSLALQLDATSAFGTGEHPTTRGCLLMLDELLAQQGKTAKKWKMLDMGCGSGILAMAFARATGGHALGVDRDQSAVTIARRNVRVNKMAEQVRIEQSLGYRKKLVTQQGPYDLIMANVFAEPLCEMAPDLKAHLKEGGRAILSGILNAQARAVLSAHRKQGLVLTKRMRLGEWSVLVLERPVER